MRHLLLSLIAVSFVFVSCAKNRGVEKLRTDDTVNWREKAAFTGRGETKDVYFGKWTVVKNSLDNGFIFVGYQGDINAGYFEFNENNLQFKSIQGMYKGRESATSIAPVLYQWPITHHDAQLQTTDGKTSNKEIDDDRLPWYQKKNFKIDFSNSDIAQGVNTGPAGFSCWTQAGASQVPNSVEVSAGYISYVVEVVYSRNCPNMANYVNGQNSFTVQYRYSFRKMEPSDYVPMVYEGENDPKMRKFGYFQSVKEEQTLDGRPRNIFLVNRWHPNKTHNYYFAKGFPEQYKYIFYDIFKKTNAVFEQKGLKVRFNLKENTADDGKVKELGDLRYSFVNLIETIDESAPLGYGPSDANPFTGEIISANLHVWSGFLKYYLSVLKQSAERNPGWFVNDAGKWEQDFAKSKWSKSDLFLKMKDFLQKDTNQWRQNWDAQPELADFFQHMASKTTYTYPGWNAYTSGSTLVPVQVWVDSPNPEESSHGVLAKSVAVQNDWISSIMNIEINNNVTFAKPILIGYEPYEDNVMMKKLAEHSKNMPDLSVLKEFSEQIKKYESELRENISGNIRGHCKLDMQASMAGMEASILEGFSLEQIVENIIYRTSIHELGHNLNLRHNFYGSLDKKNFLKPSVPVYAAKLDENGKPTNVKVPVLDENGQQKMWPTVSSSVMDYMRLQDEFYTTQDWEPYDVAALQYAYSGGNVTKAEDEKLYLFCTDEHTLTNAFCNRFDKGTTPTEIVTSLIETYEDGYYTRNYRFGRAYWNTGGYMGAIFTQMKEMKEFLPMWRTAFYESNLRDELKKKGYKKDQAEQMVTEVSREIKDSLKLVIAFYQAVLQTSNSDKPFRSVYTENGSLERLGISADKLVAMYFLAGDDQIYYNPNRVMLDSSFLTYSYVPEFATMMQKVSENIVTQRVDMEPWFISMGRSMYALSAMNYSNREDQGLINKIKIKKYSNLEIDNYFGIDLTGNDSSKVFAKIVTLDKSKDPDFRKGDQVAIVSYKTNFYMFSKQESPFAYDIYKNIKNAEESGSPTAEGQMDLEELYYIYSMTTGGI